jgi:hypothetical protein
MGDRSLVVTIDDFVNPEKGEEARTDALNTLLIRTLPSTSRPFHLIDLRRLLPLILIWPGVDLFA